jgi:hypothetical protein
LNGNAEPTFTDNFKHRRTHRPTRTTGWFNGMIRMYLVACNASIYRTLRSDWLHFADWFPWSWSWLTLAGWFSTALPSMDLNKYWFHSSSD